MGAINTGPQKIIVNVGKEIKDVVQEIAKDVKKSVGYDEVDVTETYDLNEDFENSATENEDAVFTIAGYEYPRYTIEGRWREPENKPTKINGTMNTYFSTNNSTWIFQRIKYKGEYLEFEHKSGIKTRVPLAVVKYENDKIVLEEMTEEEKKRYTYYATNYYNDIFDLLDSSTSPKFKEEIYKRLDNVVLLYIDPNSHDQMDDSRGAAGYCAQENGTSNHSDIVMFTNEFFELRDENHIGNAWLSYQYMLEGFIHECGHAFANDKIKFPDRDDNQQWEIIYNQVSANEENRMLLRDYSFTNLCELFADSTMYYFTNPDVLKMIEINIDGYSTLYEYMDDILGGKEWKRPIVGT